MSEYRKTHRGCLYFVTLTVVGWIDVFNRECYIEELVKNLKYCQDKEGLEIYAYVIMSSHIHLVAGREENNLGELLGRFKSVTAKKMLKMIKENPQESRKEWMLYMFEYYAKKNKQYDRYHFWQYANKPVELFSNEVIDQKVNYIHNNPVEAGMVSEPYHYNWSSANPDSIIKTLRL